MDDLCSMTYVINLVQGEGKDFRAQDTTQS